MLVKNAFIVSWVSLSLSLSLSHSRALTLSLSLSLSVSNKGADKHSDITSNKWRVRWSDK